MPSAISPIPGRTGEAFRNFLGGSPITAARNAAGFEIRIDPRALSQLFAGTVGLLLLLHVIVQTLRFTLFDGASMGGLVPLFSLGSDGNLPTFYSAFALLFSGLVLLAIGVAALQTHQRDGWYWIGLAATFAFLSLDEMLELHEQLIEPVRNALGAGGLLFYAWIVPYSAATILLVTVYWNFLWRLPRDIAKWMVLAGAIFVAGAVGVEMLGGLVFERMGSINPIYVLLQTIEEVCEMSGIVLFIYATSTYFVRQNGSLSLWLVPEEVDTPEPE